MHKRDIRVQIVIIQNGKYILLKHHHKKEQRYFWGLPGGGVEDGEAPSDAAIREAKEETGLDIKLLPYCNDITFTNNPVYNRKMTFIGYPVDGVARTGYDPEPEMVNYYELVDIKWHFLYDIDTLDDYTKEDILPVIQFIQNNDFIKRAGTVVCRNINHKLHFLLTSRLVNKNEYVLPQGRVETNELLEDTALRETREEAGVNCKIIKELGLFFSSNDKGITQTHIFLAEYLNECEKKEERVVVWKTNEETKTLCILNESKRFIEDFCLEENLC